METSRFRLCAFGAALTLWLAGQVLFGEPVRIDVDRALPENALQPQATVDATGVTHLIYFKGEPAAGDIFYVRKAPGAGPFSRPLRVNSEAGSAMAIGTIRGAQLSVGRGRVHVAWNGLAPKGGNYMNAPMLYTRLDDTGNAFEHERNLIQVAGGLDGGGSVAADEAGNVAVFWHAPKPGNTNGEAGRALFVARSRDEGRTFERETLATQKATGACGCCGMKAFTDSQGHWFALFRGATDKIDRDEILLGGRFGEELQVLTQHPWKIASCPMSSASFATAGKATYAAWESRDKIFFTRIEGLRPGTPIALPGAAKQKHPALAVNFKGEVVVVWTEGTSWGRGGAVAWQVYNSEGITDTQGRADGLPAWSLPAVVAENDGSFKIYY